MRDWPPILSVVVALAGCVSQPQAQPVATPLGAAAFHDDCTAAPGYSEFRSKLAAVVSARDGDAFRALFHPNGAMRLNGIGGNAGTPDWGLGRPEAAGVWKQLDEILLLGCAPEGEKLVLPGIARLRGDVNEDQLVVMQDAAMRSEASSTGAIVGTAKRGQVFTFTDFDTPDGWTSVIVDGKTAWLPSSTLRSPYAVQLVLVPYEGGWRIRELSPGV